MNYKKILAKNVEALKATSTELTSAIKIARRCTELGYHIGARTIGHLLDENDDQSPTLDTIVALAAAYRVKPWMLLRSDFNSINPGKTGEDIAPEIVELARRMMQLPPNSIKLLLEIMANPASDEHLEKNGWHTSIDQARAPTPKYEAIPLRQRPKSRPR